MKLEELQNKKILILGFAREGIDVFKFLYQQVPLKNITIGDKLEKSQLLLEAKNIIKKHKPHCLLGKNYLKNLSSYDIIIKSPGIPLNILKLKKTQIITSQTELFFNNCKGLIIGITGTKGKSTLASLIYHALKKAGKKAYLVGNIGHSSLKHVFKSGIFIYELSSFQLMSLGIQNKINPNPFIAVFLNVFRDHLDYHQSFQEYVLAKKRIFSFQSKNHYIVFNKKDSLVSKLSHKAKSIKVPFDPQKYISKKLLISLDPVFAIFKILGISKKAIFQAEKEFVSLPHRTEFIGKFKGILFYNDSAATIPQATIKALEVLGNKVNTLIVGGVDKGFDFKDLAKVILSKKISNIILFPNTGKNIEKELLKLKNNVSFLHANSMKEAVVLSYLHTQKGNICLLSPAASSFNMFVNYKERGNQFRKYVKKYSKN